MIPLLVAACASPIPDPPEAVVGERLFLEPRFAQFFAVNAGGEVNAPLAEGDPTLEVEARDAGDVPGPFAGSTMSCRQCHLVDDVTANIDAPVRTYADFAPRSPIPDRGDGLAFTVRNSPSLVDSTHDHTGPLHFDGEFPTPEDLVRGTFSGRNFGWLPAEHDDAVAHLAATVRGDDGSFPLVADGAAIPYATLFAGTDPSIPERLRVPPSLRIDVPDATDEEILDGVAAFVAAYLDTIRYARGLESDVHVGSPYDVFLAKNGLPQAPSAGEDPLGYARRLRDALDATPDPDWVDDVDQRYTLHDRAFLFGPAELRGLRIFLTEPVAVQEPLPSGVGNCIACHTPPDFTDFALHNTGVSQEAYDAVWGDGAFAAMTIPDLATREADPDPWLPSSPTHPSWAGAMRAIPDVDHPGHADLGAWSIFLHPDHPEAQEGLRSLIDAAYGPCTDAERLGHAIGLFKTPSLRDLAQSTPFLHDGSAADLEAVLTHYQRVADRQRAGTLRNGDPRLADMSLSNADLADLHAFLDALTEDYE